MKKQERIEALRDEIDMLDKEIPYSNYSKKLVRKRDSLRKKLWRLADDRDEDRTGTPG